jgi:Tfp pilus assembly protein PilO
VSVSDRDRKILMAIVPFLLVGAYWFLLLSPKRQEASTAAGALAKQEERRDSAEATAEAARSAEDGFSADYTQIVRLGKAIPTQVDMPSLLVQLDAAAAGTGIRFTKIVQGERVAAVAATPPESEGSGAGDTGTPAANAAQQEANDSAAAAEESGAGSTGGETSTSSGSGLPVSGEPTASAPAGLETVPLQLEFVGNFFNLADFFHRIKRFVNVANNSVVVSGRLITVEGVRWSSDSEIFPRVRAELTATVYLSPEAQGNTAGATPQGPPASVPAASATPAESAPAPGAAPAATATP